MKQIRKKITNSTPAELKLAILHFSWTHGVSISPIKNLDNFIARQKLTGHCACKDDREYCPCDQAWNEILAGHQCVCGLFVDGIRLAELQVKIMRKMIENPEYRPDK